MIQEKNTASYDILSDSFSANMYLRSDEKNAVLKYFIDKTAPLLVVGCGAGRVPFYLHKMGYENITAVDISSSMVEKAKIKLKNLKGVRVLKADALELPFDQESFNHVFFPFHGIDYVTERKKVIVELKRVLKVGGNMVFTSHNLLFPRSFKKFVFGKRTGKYLHLEEKGNVLRTYHTTVAEIFSLKKIFQQASVHGRVYLQGGINLSIKDKIFYRLPFLDKSLYFVVWK